ncbi:MAG TPA: hypothetical protein VF407_13870 [Polyangiaceae bacterium]
MEPKSASRRRGGDDVARQIQIALLALADHEFGCGPVAAEYPGPYPRLQLVEDEVPYLLDIPRQPGNSDAEPFESRRQNIPDFPPSIVADRSPRTDFGWCTAASQAKARLVVEPAHAGAGAG